MSAFMCSPAHFDALADYASRNRVDVDVSHDAKYLDTKKVGAILRDENARSVEARYADCKSSNAMGTKNVYTFRPVDKHLTDAGALAALQCYEYQSCESDDWTETLAFAVCQAIQANAIRQITKDEKWALAEDDVRVNVVLSRGN